MSPGFNKRKEMSYFESLIKKMRLFFIVKSQTGIFKLQNSVPRKEGGTLRFVLINKPSSFNLFARQIK